MDQEHPGLAWSEGDVGAGGRRSLSSPTEFPGAHTLPSKPLNNGPFLPCLGTETGIKGQWECRWQGPSTQRGKEGHAQPEVPSTAPSVLP